MATPAWGYVKPTGFTIFGWFLRTTLPTSTEYEAFFSQQSQVTQNWRGSLAQEQGRQVYMAFSSNSFLHFHVYNESTATRVIDYTSADTIDAVNDGAWHFFAVRLAADKKTFTIWLDDEILTTQTAPSAVDWNPGSLTFGGTYALWQSNTGHDLWKGSFAHLAIINRPVSDSRIAEYLAAGTSGSVYAGDTEVQRLERVFDWADVPEVARAYDPALTTLQAVDLGSNANDTASTTGDAALGLVFADGTGRVVYQNRRRRYNRFVFATLAESLGSSAEVGLTWETDPDYLYNDVRGSRTDGATIRLQSQASQDQYDRRTYEITPAINSDTELQQMCSWILGRYSQDRTRLESVTIQAESSDIGQYIGECVQIGDKIALDELPDNAPATYLEYIVDSISYDMDFQNQTWAVTLELTPAELYKVFQVGTSTVGDGSFVAF